MNIKPSDNIIKKYQEERENIFKMNKETNFYHYTKEKVLEENMCDFIINEAEKFASNNKTKMNPTGWTTKRHFNYPTTDLPIKEIPTLNNYVSNFIIINVFDFISEKYKINKYHLDLNDIFIVKYEYNKQNYLEKHKDGSLFSFNILLNDHTDFEGGGTKFYYRDEVETCKNTKGGIIIHSGRIFHEGIPITKGIRYILVGFIGYLKVFCFSNKNILIEQNLKSTDNKFINKQKFNCWNIILKDNNIYNKIINNCNFKGMYLLNTNKKKYSYVEKLIKELVEFHSIRLNKDFLSDNYYIEFWIKSQEETHSEHLFHIDKDELYLKKYGQLFIPILSSVTYLSTSINPTIITNIPDNINNFNNIHQQNLIISFPKKLNHIIFQGKYIHGVKKIIDYENNNDSNCRITMMFNIWQRKPYLRNFYNNNDDDDAEITNDLIHDLKENKNYKNLRLEQNTIKSINNKLIKNEQLDINIFNSLFKNLDKDIYFIS
jgi:hypothetical protein